MTIIQPLIITSAIGVLFVTSVAIGEEVSTSNNALLEPLNAISNEEFGATVKEAFLLRRKQLVTVDEKTGGTVEVNCRFVDNNQSMKLAFIVPDGYKKHSFNCDTHEYRGTSWCKWEDKNDPKNGTVKFYADCRPWGDAKTSLSGVYAIPE